VLGEAPGATRGSGSGWRLLAETECFSMYEGVAGVAGEAPGGSGPRVVVVLEGVVEVGGVAARTGQTVLIPAAWDGELSGGGRCLLALVR
jgi:hypothetical protein